MAEFAEEGVLDMDYDSLLKRSVFASFQALHFSSAAARVKQGMETRESNLKAALSKAIGEMELETVAHAETLLELSRTRNELGMAKDALKSLDEKMLKTLEDHEKELKEIAVQYTLMARIGMMLESAEQKATWNVQEEIGAFKLKFPESSLEEWGVSEVEDNPAVTNCTRIPVFKKAKQGSGLTVGRVANGPPTIKSVKDENEFILIHDKV